MKLLVCGGRTYNNRCAIQRALALLVEHGSAITHIIHGCAAGADQCASDIARLLGVQEVRCPADWHNNGKTAGPIRNTAMLALKPDAVVAAPGGKGTADMVRKAKAAGIPVYEIRE